MKPLKFVVVALILLLGIYVAISPGLVYAPTPRVILYFLVSFLPALLLGAEASSKFVMRLPGFAFTTAGACAVCFGALFLLTYLSKPEEKIAVYEILDESNNPVALDWPGAVKLSISDNALTVTKFIDGNTIVLVFPEQVSKVKLSIKTGQSSQSYSTELSYAGSHISTLSVGRQLKIEPN